MVSRMSRNFMLAAILLTSACASTTLQDIDVTSSPAHAAVTLACPGQEPRHAGYTPTTVTLRRDGDGCAITLSKLGYREETIAFRQARSDAAPSLLFTAATGVVSALAWMMSGNDIVEETLREHRGTAPELVPRQVHVELVPR
ncbi:MAG TPA: hypothetical protein VG323_15955 [Thermoanaerobaculia bacterium]|nr:hypothetical protein [Thermoanaerobaculia bacterium]